MIYFELFWSFFKIGAFTFGGGYAMIELIRQEVEARGWMGMEELINFIAVSESTPGPVAINMATYIGAETAGLFGAFCATSAVVLPSFIIIMAIAKIYSKIVDNKYFKGCMSGLKPAVTGLIGAALYSTAYTVFFPGGIVLDVFAGTAFWLSAGILAIDVFLTIKKAHPILIIVTSAVLGIAAGYAEKLWS